AGSPVAAATRAPFTLQVGAFAEQRRARKAARDVGALARRHGYGPVRVVPTLDARGRPMYLVQFGAFGSRQSAAQARSRVGRLDFIVAAADD
ncbi:MAG: SPOR domain-containing protein, partial [Planctomycetota bacterium]